MAVYIPSGGGILIKDATATPDDVASGMIFYNNDGRQVGIGKMVKKILFPQDLSTPSESSDTISGYTYSSSDGYTFGLYDVDTGAFWKGYYCKISGIEHIIGVEIDGHYSFCPSASNSIYTIYGIRNNNTGLLF